MVLGSVNTTEMEKKKNPKIAKSLRARYRRIGKSEWFKKHYENKSLGETIEIIDEG